MGCSYAGKLMIGVPLKDFFTELNVEDTSYEEHDKRGKKTGKTINEEKLIATFPNGDKRVISTEREKYDADRWVIWWEEFFEEGYDSVEIGTLYPQSECRPMDMILGLEIEADEDDSTVQVIPERLNLLIQNVTKQLKEKYEYSGDVGIYLSLYVGC